MRRAEIERSRESAEMTAEEGEVAVVSRPRTTGSLRRVRVRNRPETGSTLTSVSLNELVPMSTAAKRLLLAVDVAVIGAG